MIFPDLTPRRIFIDLSYAYAYDEGETGGGARVVREVEKHLVSASRAHQVECHAVASGSRYCEISLSFFSKIKIALVVPMSWLGPGFHHAAAGDRESRRFGLGKLFQCRIRQRVNCTEDLSVRILRTVLRAGRLGFRRPPVRFVPGDVLFLLLPSTEIPRRDELEAAKRSGAIIGFCLYDLCPIAFPELRPAWQEEHLGRMLQQMEGCADFCLTISEAIKSEFVNYRKTAGRSDRSLPCRSFRLGAGVNGKPGAHSVRQEVLDAFAGEPWKRPYLMVATLEPNKNHACLLDAFDLLWNHGFGGKLCLVGRVGGIAAEMLARIRTHRMRQKRLFMFHDLTDAEVGYCYRHARALVWPSLYEGFGLPIIEALSAGLPVITSDIPVHREIGGNFCAYFKPDDPGRLAELIRSFDETGTLEGTRPMSEFRWPDWDAATKELLLAIQESYRAVRDGALVGIDQ